MKKFQSNLWELRNSLLRVYYSKRLVTKWQKYGMYIAWMPLHVYLINAFYLSNFDEFTMVKRTAHAHSKMSGYFQHMDDLDDYTHDVLMHDYKQRRFLQ